MPATEELPTVAQPGLAMGRYRLGARLGAGGFGTVYAARDERLGRPVAVKVIPAGNAAPERAQREARAVARLDHDAIVGLFDAGEEDGCRYLVSELVEGRTLAQLESAGELSDRDVLRIGLALADALAHAHERGVIHRDVKPQNVIVPDMPSSRRGAAKLTDFGVAHLAGEDALTRTGDVVGTLAYMAPEQAAGRAVDEHADLYALGLVLYEALAGENPVNAGSPSATARRIGTVLPPLARRRADLPQELCAALDRAIVPNPEQRGELDDLFDALADALGAVSDDGGLIAPHPLERGLPALPPALGRVVAPAAAAALAWAALAGLSPEPALPPPAVALATAALVAVLPRVGWLAAAIGVPLLLTLGPVQRPGAALVVAALALASPLLLRADGRAWALPALAPALGLLGLAGAYTALAGRAPRWSARVALGALGAWWVALAEPLLARALVFGAAPETPARAGFDGAPGITAGDVIAPAVSSGALLLGVIWAAAALVLPWLVRGRSLASDVVAAAAWSAGTAAATIALGEWLGDRVGQSAPHGLAAGAVVAAVLALLPAHARRTAARAETGCDPG
ncbi:MAG TPA: serine/threonine-protein kinase [Solirubrobacteraceae bacterium]|nr:serine/threonine-protein kinase [Solirubrobacteraceae bacterium]